MSEEKSGLIPVDRKIKEKLNNQIKKRASMAKIIQEFCRGRKSLKLELMKKLFTPIL